MTTLIKLIIISAILSTKDLSEPIEPPIESMELHETPTDKGSDSSNLDIDKIIIISILIIIIICIGSGPIQWFKPNYRSRKVPVKRRKKSMVAKMYFSPKKFLFKK